MNLPIMTAGPTGLCIALAPDVCLTPAPPAPPLPIPYPNLGRTADGKGESNVLVDGAEVLRVGDSLSRSTGDEPGNAPGGIRSGSYTGKITATDSPQDKVKAGGKIVMTVLGGTDQNHFSPANTKGAHTAPSQNRAWIRPTHVRGYGANKVDPLQDAMEILQCSSTIYEQLKDFTEMNGTVRYGKPGEPSRQEIQGQRWYETYTEKPKMTIYINPSLSNTPSAIVSILAFQLGRALDGAPDTLYHPGMSQQEFMKTNVDRKLRNEAKGHYNQCFIRDQIFNNCPEVDIGNLSPSDEMHDDYMKAYNGQGWESWGQKWFTPKPPSTEVPYQGKLERMAELVGKSQAAPGQTCRQFFEKSVEQVWTWHSRFFSKPPIG